jgi:microcystin-dependent protein
LNCDGTAYDIAKYPALYSAIGNTFGSSSPTFLVPNLSNRVPYGASAGRPLNTTGGTATETLTAAQSATRNHTHSYGDYYNDTSSGTCNAASGAGSNFNQTTASEFTDYQSANASQSHNNLQPYIVLNFIIKT